MRKLAGLTLLIASCASPPTEIADACMEWQDDQLPVAYLTAPAIPIELGGSARLERVTSNDGRGSFLQVRIQFDRARLHSLAVDARGERHTLVAWPPTCTLPLLDLESGSELAMRVERDWLEARRRDGIGLTLVGDERFDDVVVIPARQVEGFLLALDQRQGQGEG